MSLVRRVAQTCLLAFGFLCLAPWARAQDAASLEEPEYPPPPTRYQVAALGLGTTAAFYGLGVGASYIFDDTQGIRYFRTPVVGPWLAIANGGCPQGQDCSDVLAVFRIILSALDGIGQAGGLAIAVEGLLMPTQERARVAPPSTSPRPSAPPAKQPAPETNPEESPKNLFMAPVPIVVGSGGVGIGIVGRF